MNSVETGGFHRRIDMDGPGEYLPDGTEGITRIEDLPKAKVIKHSRNTIAGCAPSAGIRPTAIGYSNEPCMFLAV